MIVEAPGASAFTAPSRRCRRRRRRRRRRRSRPPPASSSLCLSLSSSSPLSFSLSLSRSYLACSCVYVRRSIIGAESVTDKLFRRKRTGQESWVMCKGFV